MSAIIKTTAEEWEHYRALVYPAGISQTQEVECCQAFYSGALTVLTRLHQLRNSGSLQIAQAGLDQMDDELIAWHKARLKEKGAA